MSENGLITKTYFNIFCIDKRFDYLSSEYFKAIGFTDNYYLGTTAGAALCLGYSEYCREICNCHCNNDNTECDPLNPDMELLKLSLTKNIDISLSLDPIKEVYLLNHQDCGAIKAFLSCSGYPQNAGDNNPLEIKINTELLLFAKQYLEKKFVNIEFYKLGLMDINGSVADYDIRYGTWNLVYRGPGFNPKGLWFGL
jgi:hypothetical protein